MELNIDAKFEEEQTYAFKNDMKNMSNLHRLKNSDFILESKMVEPHQDKDSNNQIDQMQCENFILPWI